MSSTLSFVVPCEPVPKGRPRAFVRKGQIATFTPAKTRSYETTAAAYAMKARCESRWTFTPEDRFAVSAVFYRSAERGDLDNYAKALLDALNGVVFHDDRQVRELAISLRKDTAHPRTEVSIRRVESGGQPSASSD